MLEMVPVVGAVKPRRRGRATFADNAMGFAPALAMPFVLPSDKTSLFAAIVERGTADYVSVWDLTLKVGIMAA